MVSDMDRISCGQLRFPDETEPVEREFVLLMTPVSAIGMYLNSGSDVI